MKTFLLIFFALFFGLGVYRWVEGSKQAGKEPNSISIWVTGETQKQLFFEQEKSTFLVWVTSANNKTIQPSGMLFDPQYRPRWISLDSPGGLSGGFEIFVQWPGKQGSNDYYESSGFPKGTFCFEYKLDNDDTFFVGNYLRPMKCPM